MASAVLHGLYEMSVSLCILAYQDSKIASAARKAGLAKLQPSIFQR